MLIEVLLNKIFIKFKNTYNKYNSLRVQCLFAVKFKTELELVIKKTASDEEAVIIFNNFIKHH